MGTGDGPHRVGSAPAPGAIEELQALSHQDPFDEAVHTRYAEALQSAYTAARGPSEAPCGCGSGRPYRVCCQGRHRRALRRFTDRQPLYRLRDVLLDYFEDPDFEPARRLALEAWLGDEAPSPDEELLPQGAADPPHLFAYEWAFSLLPVHGSGAHDHCLLECFAGNPDVPALLASQADDWLECCRWGLWQSSSTRAPGVWLTDLLSGLRRYVSIPPEQLQGHPTSSVAIGQIFPMDGVWRTGGVLVITGVEQAQRIAAAVLESKEEILAMQRPGRQRRGRRAAPAPPPPEELDQLTSWMVGLTLPALCAMAEMPDSFMAAAGP